MAAHPAPLSLGFSKQEYWSGLPFPSAMHACMLSRFSHVQLCATPWKTVHQAPLPTGFSIQEYWSGLPFPSPVYSTKPFYIKDLSILGLWYPRVGMWAIPWGHRVLTIPWRCPFFCIAITQASVCSSLVPFILEQRSLYCGHVKMFNRIFDLYPQDINSTLQIMNPKCLQTSTVVLCVWMLVAGERDELLLRTAAFLQLIITSFLLEYNCFTMLHFCYTMKWINYMYTYDPFFLALPFTPPLSHLN